MSESRLRRFRSFWVRHRTLFWSLHSVWALATGVLVIVLARERYGFLPWLVLFLALTWASTLFFNGRGSGADARSHADSSDAPPLGDEATSYVTRTMYQETLFFLLPFYAYSTVLGSINMGFVLLLGALALLSCLDLLFDRWMRSSALFSMLFFSLIAFAAVNLLLPILFPIDPSVSTPAAAGLAVASAVPLAMRGAAPSRRSWGMLGLAAVALLGVATWLPSVIPPVPLRLESAVFTSDIERSTLVPRDTLVGSVRADELNGALFLLVEVFAPAVVPTRVSLQWLHDGTLVRASREVEITAHEGGFRLWDAWRPDPPGLPAGQYEVRLYARGDRAFGSTRIFIEPARSP